MTNEPRPARRPVVIFRCPRCGFSDVNPMTLRHYHEHLGQEITLFYCRACNGWLGSRLPVN